MASPPSRTDLAGTPTVATYKLAIGGLYDYVASLLGNGTATIASETEKKLARENLGVGNFGFKNRFVNSNFIISQEFSNSSIPIPVSADPKYLVDQWFAYSVGETITAQQIDGISDQIKSLRITGATSNTGFSLNQRIESLNCSDFKNKNVTVSINSKSTSSKVITWVAYYANVKDTFATRTTIATGTINIGTNVERLSFTFNAGANAVNGLQISFIGGALLAGESIDFDKCQIEESSIATEYEAKSGYDELISCFRYFEKGIVQIRGAGSSAIAVSSNFKGLKRVAPTIVFSGSLGTSLTTPYLSNFEFVFAGTSDAAGYLSAFYSANARL